MLAFPVMCSAADAAIQHGHKLTTGHHGVAIAYCLAIVAASLLGGALPKFVALTHGRLQLSISFVGGLMLGISVFHLLPHALVEVGGKRVDAVMLSLMFGMIAMFLLLRMFHFHDHGPAEVPEVPHSHDHDHDHDDHGACAAPAVVSLEAAYSHDHGHGHSHGAGREMSWMGVCFGLSVHSLLDGMALGASMQAGVHGTGALLVGFGTFLAILLHKPLDSVSIAVLMRNGKCPSNWRLAVNLLYSLMCPIGVLIFLSGFSALTNQSPEMVGYTLAFAAGVFLCISLGDLLPEMEFHSHHRIQLTLALLLGIAVAWFVRLAEVDTAHQIPVPSAGAMQKGSADASKSRNRQTMNAAVHSAKERSFVEQNVTMATTDFLTVSKLQIIRKASAFGGIRVLM